MFATSSGGSSPVFIVYLVIFAALYFGLIRPRRKKRQREAVMAAKRPNDSRNDGASSVNISFGPPNAQIAGRSVPSSHLDEIAKLAEMRDRGILTETEFQIEKARLLGSR